MDKLLRRRPKPIKYPCVMQDMQSGMYFIAEPSGALTGRYHKSWWRAWIELMTSL